MQFGLFSNSDRHPRSAAHWWDEDLKEIAVAERLGFVETWIAEHVTGKMPSPDLLICKAAMATRRMRLGPGVRQLPLYHPVQVALEAAVCDHLTGGRYMAGFGGAAGGGVHQMSQRGSPFGPDEAREMMHEAIDLIVRCWMEPDPFDYEGRFWHGKGIRVMPKPLQQPHMPVGLAVTSSPSSAELAGHRGFLPLHSFHDAPPSLTELTNVFEEAARSAGRESCRNDIRLCRYVYVSDSDRKARDEIRASITPWVEGWKRQLPWQFERFSPAGGFLDDVTFDRLADLGVYIVGSPDTVYGRIVELYQAVGGFGVLLLIAGKDIGTLRQRLRSWRLCAREVAPRLAELTPHPGAGLGWPQPASA